MTQVEAAPMMPFSSISSGPCVCGNESTFKVPAPDIWNTGGLGASSAADNFVACLQRALFMDMPEQQQELRALTSPTVTAAAASLALPTLDLLPGMRLDHEQLQLPSGLLGWGIDSTAAAAFAEPAFAPFSLPSFGADATSSSAASSVHGSSDGSSSSSGGRSPTGGACQLYKQQQQQQQHQGPTNSQQQRRRLSQRNSEEAVRRTVYVSGLHAQITEASLALFFESRLLCAKVVDCRVCGEPNSTTRFAFVEFAHEGSALQALAMTGSLLGSLIIRVMPSKTAIVPVNAELMPQTPGELERCLRTVYVSNIDKAVDKATLRAFFEQLCGPISRIQQHGALGHPAAATRIAFVEFAQPEGALAALAITGAMLGSRALRCFPSKTPVRSKGSHTKAHA